MLIPARSPGASLWLAAFVLFVSSPLHAATITQLTGYAELVAPTVEGFESGLPGSGVTFNPTAEKGNATTWSSGWTASGSQGLVERSGSAGAGGTAGLSASLAADAYGVGLTFGNDDFGREFDVFLSVYDAADNHLGTFSVRSNGNDFADQFIGLASDTAFRRVGIRYADAALAIYVDDFAYSGDPESLSKIPEPSSAALLGLGMWALIASRRR